METMTIVRNAIKIGHNAAPCYRYPRYSRTSHEVRQQRRRVLERDFLLRPQKRSILHARASPSPHFSSPFYLPCSKFLAVSVSSPGFWSVYFKNINTGVKLLRSFKLIDFVISIILIWTRRSIFLDRVYRKI